MVKIPEVCGRANLPNNARVRDFGAGDGRTEPPNCPARITPASTAVLEVQGLNLSGSPECVADLTTNTVSGAQVIGRDESIDPLAELVLARINGTKTTIKAAIQQEVTVNGAKYPAIRSIVYLNTSGAPARIEAQRASINGADFVTIPAGGIGFLTSKPVVVGGQVVEYAIATFP